VHPPPAAAPDAPRCLAIVVARDEEAALPGVLAGLPEEACGMPVDKLVVDDGSRDATGRIAREAGAEVIAHPESLGLGAGLRAGLASARECDYAAAVYLDGDGEYDPADFARVLEPVARGRADYVLGSRFLGERDGMSWHRDIANRATSALLGTLMGGTIISDGQTGYRAFSARALAAAEIRHDYNYAQVLTLSLWGAGIEPVEVPISYRRRTSGRSFVRYPEYFRRVVPALLAAWRQSSRARRAAGVSADDAERDPARGRALHAGGAGGDRGAVAARLQGLPADAAAEAGADLAGPSHTSP
jgi:glycosyltransferase involved in cell wall biosynthesis